MRSHLRRTLIELVLAATPLSLTAGCDPFDGTTPPDASCTTQTSRIVRVAEPPPMELAMLVRACEADQAECLALCNAVLSSSGSIWDGFPGPTVVGCDVSHDATGHEVSVQYLIASGAPGCPVDGRRPHGLRRARGTRAGIVGAYLARSAHFEAASVHAFVRLARELTRLGAPIELREAAQRAAADEVRHARTMTRLAHSRGAVPPPVELAAPKRRSLEALAVENATEGVVGETWAALVAFYQARHAPDAALRAAYAEIAEEETAHAELSRAVDAWACTRLRPAARARVVAARTRALARLRRGIRTGAPTELIAELGMPAPAVMRQLYDGLWGTQRAA